MKLLFFIFCFFIFVSCGTTSRISSFYIKPEVIQYFLKPVEMNGHTGKVLVDFTFKDIKETNSLCICNFSVVQADYQTLKSIEACFVLDNKQTIQLSNITVMFIEPSEHLIRFTSTTYESEIKNLVKQTKFQLKITSNSKNYFYDPSSDMVSQFEEAALTF